MDSVRNCRTTGTGSLSIFSITTSACASNFTGDARDGIRSNRSCMVDWGTRWTARIRDKRIKKRPKTPLTGQGKTGTIGIREDVRAAPQAAPSASKKNRENLQSIAKGGLVTQRAIKQLETLRRATARYSPLVKAQLSKAGKKSDSATVESAAKYYMALKKLASK